MQEDRFKIQPGPAMRVPLLPRPQGDGMDSESMRYGIPSKTFDGRPQRGHRNLTQTQNTMSTAKVPKLKYIPHEPVRGAVKAVQIGTSQVPVVSAANPALNQSPNKGLTSAGAVNTVQRSMNQILPSGSSHSNSAIQKNTNGQYNPKLRDQVNINMENMANTPEKEHREIEGELYSRNPSVQKLQEEVELLKKQIDAQIGVNSDLKKLLVASVGDDMHCKVESLVKDKVHLGMEITDYTERLNQGSEDIDKLAIQADLWRSKYKASQMLVEQLTSTAKYVGQQYEKMNNALQQMFLERQQIREELLQTYKQLKQLKDTFDPMSAQRRSLVSGNIIFLSRTNAQLSETVKNKLIGKTQVFPAIQVDNHDVLTPAEMLASHSLHSSSTAHVLCTKENPRGLTKDQLDNFNRFHPSTRYDNITFNCCKMCKGEIQVI